MKKKLIYSSVLTALLSASSIALAGGPEVIIPEPDYFSGFYIGGMGGVHHDTFNGTSSVDLTESIVTPTIIINPIELVQEGNLNTTNFSGGEWDGYGGIQGGFGLEVQHMFYVGVVGWGEFGSSSDTVSQTATVPFNSPRAIFIPRQTPDGIIFIPVGTTTRSQSATTSTTVKISNQAGIGGKFGWVVAPRSLLYGKVGASWARIQVSNSLDVNSSFSFTNNAGVTQFATNTDLDASSSATDWKVGLKLGAGFEQFVYERLVSIFAEYDYTNYGHVSTPLAFLNGQTTVNTNDRDGDNPRTATFNVNTNVATSANASVKTSELMAGLNFYASIFGG